LLSGAAAWFGSTDWGISSTCPSPEVASEFVSGTSSQSVWDVGGDAEESSAAPEEPSAAETGGPESSSAADVGGPGMLSDSDADGVAPSPDCANVIGAIQSDAAPTTTIRVVANRGIFAAFILKQNGPWSLL
jgi:hypothetical protein